MVHGIATIQRNTIYTGLINVDYAFIFSNHDLNILKSVYPGRGNRSHCWNLAKFPPLSSLMCALDLKVLTMSEGEESHFFIAPDLAYGDLAHQWTFRSLWCSLTWR